MSKGSLVKSLGRDTIWTAIGRSSGAAGTLVANALLARLLSPSDMGLFVLATSLVWFLSLVGLAGQNHFLVAELPRHSENQTTRQTTMFSGFLVAFGVTTLLLLCLRWAWINSVLQSVFKFDPSLLAGAGSFWLFALVVQNLVSESLRGSHRLRAAAWATGSLASVLFGTFLAILYFSHQKVELQQVIAINAVIIFVVAAGFSFLLNWIPPVGAPWPRLAHTLKSGIPFLLTNLTIYLSSQLDVLLLGGLRGPEDVAFYGVALRLVLVLTLPLALLNAALAPRLALFHSQNSLKSNESEIRKASGIVFLLTLPMALVLLFFAPSVLGVMFGPEYIQSANALRILSLGYLIHIFAGSPGFVLLMCGRQKVMLAIMVVSVLYFAVAGYILTNAFGLTGAAIACSSSLVLQTILSWFFTQRIFSIYTHGSFRNF